jgi:chaperonin GroEL
MDSTVVVDLVRDNPRPFGSKVEAPKYGDLVGEGVIGPSKVVRFALQNAAKAASLFRATEVMIAAIQGKDLEAQAICGAGSGGMGDM